jgi:hypothetical protein
VVVLFRTVEQKDDEFTKVFEATAKKYDDKIFFAYADFTD